MNISRPTGTPGWASGPSGYVVEPSTTTKALGWQAGQAPPASYENWWHNNVYQWQQYLDDQRKFAAMDTLVCDDFVRADYGLGTTALIGPVWRGTTGCVTLFQTSNGQLNDGNGIVALAASFSNATASLETNIGSIGDRDFRISITSRVSQRGASGCFFEQGIFGVCSLVSTGPTGFYGFRFTPSGRSPTSVALTVGPSGVDPLSSTQHRYEIIRHGGTMAVTVDGVVSAAMPASPMHCPTGLSGGNYFGMRGFCTSGAAAGGTFYNAIADRIELKIER